MASDKTKSDVPLRGLIKIIGTSLCSGSVYLLGNRLIAAGSPNPSSAIPQLPLIGMIGCLGLIIKDLVRILRRTRIQLLLVKFKGRFHEKTAAVVYPEGAAPVGPTPGPEGTALLPRRRFVDFILIGTVR